MSKEICCNCKHGGQQFKIAKLTHLHCEHPNPKVNPPYLDHMTPWDTLREFGKSCNSFESKKDN